MGREYLCPLTDGRKYLEKAGEDQGGSTHHVSGDDSPTVNLSTWINCKQFLILVASLSGL